MSMWTRNPTPLTCLFTFPLRKTLCSPSDVVSPSFQVLSSYFTEPPEILFLYLYISRASSWIFPAALSLSLCSTILNLSLCSTTLSLSCSATLDLSLCSTTLSLSLCSTTLSLLFCSTTLSLSLCSITTLRAGHAYGLSIVRPSLSLVVHKQSVCLELCVRVILLNLYSGVRLLFLNVCSVRDLHRLSNT